MLKHYPHLSFILFSYVFAAFLFLVLGSSFFHSLVLPFGIGGLFIAGMMYSYSFTIGIAALLLPAFLDQFTPVMIALVGGFGGAFADFLLFRLFKDNLKKELKRLGGTVFFKSIGRFPLMRARWFRDVLGALVIISPLPDEVGIAIMASAHLSENTFRLISFTCNVIGIYLLVSAVAGIY